MNQNPWLLALRDGVLFIVIGSGVAGLAYLLRWWFVVLFVVLFAYGSRVVYYDEKLSEEKRTER